MNLFVAKRAEQTLVEEHDERGSGQQELYLILQGEAVFELDGERVSVPADRVVAVTDRTVRRSAKALSSGTELLVIGASNAAFASTWHPSHFTEIPRPG